MKSKIKNINFVKKEIQRWIDREGVNLRDIFTGIEEVLNEKKHDLVPDKYKEDLTDLLGSLNQIIVSTHIIKDRE